MGALQRTGPAPHSRNNGWRAVGLLHLSAVLFLLLAPAKSTAQVIGRPFLENYPVRVTGSSPQNWAVLQGPESVIYAANTDGLLTFTGVTWATRRTPNGGALRSLAALPNDARIFFGGYNTFGYLQPQAGGESPWHDLATTLPASERRFGTIWQCYATPTAVYYLADRSLFRVPLLGDSTGTLEQLHVNEAIRSAHLLGSDTLMVQLAESGLHVYQGGKLVPFATDIGSGTDADVPFALGQAFAATYNSFDFRKETLFLAHPTNAGLLLGTRSRGLELLRRNRLYQLKGKAQPYLMRHGILSFKQLVSGQLAIGTATGGVVILSPTGALVTIVNQAQGLQDNAIYSLTEDNEGNLWLATGAGLSRMEPLNPLTYLNADDGLVGGALTAATIGEDVYVGTRRGLFYLRQLTDAYGAEQFAFTPVPGIDHECRKLVTADGHLLAATPFGIYQIQNRRAQLVTGQSVSAWTIEASRVLPGQFWVGLENQGLAVLRRGGPSGYTLTAVPGATAEDIISLCEIPGQELWALTSTASALRLRRIGAGEKTVVLRYDTTHGIPPDGARFRWLKNRLVLTSPSGPYGFSTTANAFQPLQDLLSGVGRRLQPGALVKEGPAGELWFQDAESGRLFYTQTDTASAETATGIGTGLLRLPAGGYNAFVWEGISTWVLGEEGIYRFRKGTGHVRRTTYPTLLTRVVAGTDSVLFAAAALGPTDSSAAAALPYRLNAARFEFTAPRFRGRNLVTYQSRLVGFDASWSAWTTRPFREYSFLPAGTYTFEVRAQDIFGQLSTPARYTFTILAPWYARWWARVLFAVATLAVAIGAIRLRSRQLQLRNRQLEAMVDERTLELAQSNAALETSNRELSQKERQLSKAYDELRDTQQQLIRNEKLAAMGNLVSNFAHEINTPIGAVKGTTNHLQFVLRELLNEFPELVARLDAEARALFLDFIRLAQQQAPNEYSTREERQLRQLLLQELQKAGAPEADRLSQLLPKAGFWVLQPELHPLIVHPNGVHIVDVALQLLLLKIGLDNIANATERTRKIVSTLKTLMPGHTEERSHPPISVRETLLSAIKEYERFFRTGIELKTTFDRTLHVAAASEDLLQLWSQLIHNAVQAMGGKGQLQLVLEEEGGDARVIVEDNGPGIPPDLIEHIFEPFFTTRGGGQGSGLGLYLCSRIVEKYKGTIRPMSSEKGTRFVIRLPLAEVTVKPNA